MVIADFLKAGRVTLLSATAGLIVLIAIADYAVGMRASLGLLYVLPMMLAARVLVPLQTIALAVLCAILRSLFDLPSPHLEAALRFVFAVVAYTGSGIFVTALVRNRALVVEHLTRIRKEQELRRQVEEQLRTLVESSPAAIFTTDAAGVVLACNKAANMLFGIPDDETLRGRAIGGYVALLSDALKFHSRAEDLRTAAQCQAQRTNGEIFLAHMWFSRYSTPEGARLAAIVVDSSEEMREREEEGLRQLLRGNRIAAAAVSHEVRNLCGAIVLVCSNLSERHQIAEDEDFRGLISLVDGLERIASAELHGKVREELSDVKLRGVLDDLRIVIEPDWREIDGEVVWSLPLEVPTVLGERHGLLQAFLNLAQNSHRAVQEYPRRELHISVSVDERTATVSFSDTGPGVSDPQQLFEPFHPAADGSGLGLYVSRAVVRSYGGDLRFEPQAEGTCFRLELQVVPRSPDAWVAQ